MTTDDEELVERILNQRVRAMVQGEFDVREYRMTEAVRRFEEDARVKLAELDRLVGQAESLVKLIAEASGVPVDKRVERYIDQRMEWSQQTMMNNLYARAETMIDNMLYAREATDGTDTTT